MDQTGGVNPSTPIPQGTAQSVPGGSADSATPDQAVELVISHGDSVPQQQPTQTVATPISAPAPIVQQPTQTVSEPVLPPQPTVQTVQQSIATAEPTVALPSQPPEQPIQEVQPPHEQVIQPLPAPLQPPPVTEPVLPPEISINKSDVPQPAVSPTMVSTDPLLETSQQFVSPPRQPTNFDLVSAPSPASSQSPTYQSAAAPAPEQIYEPQPDTRPDWQKQILNDVGQSQLPISTFSSIDQSQYAQPDPYQRQANQSPVIESYGSPQQPLSSQQWEQPVDPYQYQTYGEPGGDTVIDLGDGASGGGTRRLIFIVIAAVVALGLLGGTGFAAYTYGSNAAYKKATEKYKKDLQQQALQQSEDEQQQSQDEVDETSLDFSLVDPVYKDETVQEGMNTQAQASDGFVLYVKKVTRNFESSGSLVEGNEFVKVDILVGNASKTLTAKVTNTNFTLKTQAGGTIESDASIAEYEGKIESLSLNPGAKAKMSVVFQVKKDEPLAQFVRQQTYASKTLNQTVTSKIEIQIDS